MFKKFLRLMFLVVVSLGVFQSAKAQTPRIIEESELNALKTRAEQKLKKVKYRVKFSRHDDDEVRTNVYVTRFYEFAPPDRRHIVFVSNEADGTKTMEEIFIGARHFRKNHGEDWEDITGIGSGSGMGSGNGGDNEVTKTYRYLGKTSLGNQTADLYEAETITKSKYETMFFVRIETERYWLNDDGLFLKTSWESKNDRNSPRFAVSEYEYDPNIKIEAPIIKRMPKSRKKN